MVRLQIHLDGGTRVHDTLLQVLVEEDTRVILRMECGGGERAEVRRREGKRVVNVEMGI